MRRRAMCFSTNGTAYQHIAEQEKFLLLDMIT